MNQLPPAKTHLERSKELIENSKFKNTQELIINIENIIDNLDKLDFKDNKKQQEYLFTFLLEAYYD